MKRIPDERSKLRRLLVLGMMTVVLVACGSGGTNGGGGDDLPGVCGQLAGQWRITVTEDQNSCPPPAYDGIWDEDWTISISGSSMTIKIGNSQFVFQGAVVCTNSAFQFAGEYSYPDGSDPDCIYDATLVVEGTFNDQDEFSGLADVIVFWQGGICDPADGCQRGGDLEAVRISS